MTLRRRAFLTAPLALSPGCATAQGPAAAQPRTPAVPLRERLGALGVGANVERWFAVASNNHPRRLGPAWWRGFREAGFDHVRLFIPEVGATGEGMEIPELFRGAVADATAAGLPVLIGLSDFIKHDAPWGEREWSALAARAALFARTDPGRVVLAPVNEAVFPDPAAWMPVRDRLLGVLRRAAPRHTLMWGGHEWGSWASLVQTAPPADPNTIVEVHDYVGGDAGAVEWRFGQVAAWRERHRQTVLVAELGGATAHAENRGAWAADLRQSLPVLRRLRLPATLWAYTHGGHWRMQPGEGTALYPELRGALSG
ncbi:MAG: GH5_39 / GH5_25 [uncultured Acetobacteraceae bacterium]|uniref:GH5_39 / GH5_25 n=1 Tax=uncultured Acetobacteraceae bacterium TaxID=169975 RepID=A0A6J4HMA1_9PROT|nr:MAG: GH5_39 / GH5_25 [uncultured Acetobacteraceae bacterium]